MQKRRAISYKLEVLIKKAFSFDKNRLVLTRDKFVLVKLELRLHGNFNREALKIN